MTAPTTPTGTLMHDVFVADLNAAIDAVAQHYDACERAGGGDADDDFDAATLCFTLLRRHGTKLRALAAGQAHPQGQGEPVAWYVPRHGKNAVLVMGPTKPDSDPEWTPLYAAQGQVSASVPRLPVVSVCRTARPHSLEVTLSREATKADAEELFSAFNAAPAPIPPCPHGNRGNCRTCELERATARTEEQSVEHIANVLRECAAPAPRFTAERQLSVDDLSPIPPAAEQARCKWRDRRGNQCCLPDEHISGHLTEAPAPPHAGQEPDAYTQTLMREPHRYTNRSPGTYEDHALIVALQAQHEADAARIAELWRHNCDLAQRMNELHGERTAAEAALAQAVALLREGRQAMDDWLRSYASEMCDQKKVDETYARIMEGGGTLAYIAKITDKMRTFLASAKADERSPTDEADVRRIVREEMAEAERNWRADIARSKP